MFSPSEFFVLYAKCRQSDKICKIDITAAPNEILPPFTITAADAEANTIISAAEKMMFLLNPFAVYENSDTTAQTSESTITATNETKQISNALLPKTVSDPDIMLLIVRTSG